MTGARTVAAPDTLTDALHVKEQRLHAILADLESVIVAFSGGVDSAYLAVAAQAALGPRAFAITADSPSYPDHHRQIALRVARDFQLQHEVVRTDELERPEYRANPANRCYFCKQELYTTLTRIARDRGIRAVADGSNADDRGDYRPGRQAAREHGVVSPLDQAELTKDEIRALARHAGLPTWDEPASACLSSRIPYGSEVTIDKLRMIERAEAVLRDAGFKVCRVRHHEMVGAIEGTSRVEGTASPLDEARGALSDSRRAAVPLARLEIARSEMPRALDPAISEHVVRELKAIGYQHVVLDLQGYRLGSLNEALRLRPVS
jgi:uncharacterized protein